MGLTISNPRVVTIRKDLINRTAPSHDDPVSDRVASGAAASSAGIPDALPRPAGAFGRQACRDHPALGLVGARCTNLTKYHYAALV
jgi:hypothetical protein